MACLQSFPWRLPRGNGLALPHHKERQYTIASALPKPCFFEDFYGPYAKANEKGPYFLTEYSTHQLFTQLTLLQQVHGGYGHHRGPPYPGQLQVSQDRLGDILASQDLNRHFLEESVDHRRSQQSQGTIAKSKGTQEEGSSGL